MTLLGQFYSRIYGSVEYLASESLLFILNKSKSARTCLEQYIQNLSSIKIDELHYISQNIGENNERPDISGFTESNIEKIIIETKFWASLTENQPLGYLKRIENTNGVLLFVCPSIRQKSLMNEIETIFNNEKYLYEKINEYEFKHKKTLTIISTWDIILNKIKEALIQNKEIETLSDVEQLIGLCNKIDQDSFQPIQKEDLSPKIPRQIIAYNRLIDKTIDLLSNSHCISTQGLRTTPQVFGYRRYAQINSMTFAFDCNLEAWSQYYDTPIWIQISENWKLTKHVDIVSKLIETKMHIKDIRFENNLPYFPIMLECNQTEDEVIQNISRKISDIISLFKTSA